MSRRFRLIVVLLSFLMALIFGGLVVVINNGGARYTFAFGRDVLRLSGIVRNNGRLCFRYEFRNQCSFWGQECSGGVAFYDSTKKWLESAPFRSLLPEDSSRIRGEVDIPIPDKAAAFSFFIVHERFQTPGIPLPDAGP